MVFSPVVCFDVYYLFVCLLWFLFCKSYMLLLHCHYNGYNANKIPNYHLHDLRFQQQTFKACACFADLDLKGVNRRRHVRIINTFRAAGCCAYFWGRTVTRFAPVCDFDDFFCIGLGHTATPTVSGFQNGNLPSCS